MNQNLSLRTIIIGIILLTVCVGSVWGFRHSKQTQKDQMIAHAAPVGKTLGSDSAPIRLVEFSDFECPACRAAVPILDELAKKYPGKIQTVYKHFPLRSHVWSPVAHQAAECANQQGKFWEFFHKLYDEQPVWTQVPDPLVRFAEYGQSMGMNMTQFTGCMTDSKIAENIAAEKQEGVALQVQSTPTFFINGKMFAGALELKIGGEAFIRKTLGLPEEKPADVAAQATNPAPK